MSNTCLTLAKNVFIIPPTKLIHHLKSHPKLYIALAIIASLPCVLVATTGGIVIVGTYVSEAPRFMSQLSMAISSHGNWIQYAMTGTGVGGIVGLGGLTIFEVIWLCRPKVDEVAKYRAQYNKQVDEGIDKLKDVLTNFNKHNVQPQGDNGNEDASQQKGDNREDSSKSLYNALPNSPHQQWQHVVQQLKEKPN